MSLRADRLSYRAGSNWLLRDVSLDLQPRRVHVVLGPNGAGKSTLLKLLAGDLAPAEGAVQLNGRALRNWRPLDIARQRAVLPQTESLRFAFSVEQVVALGRLPCPRHDAARERQIVLDALRTADALHLRSRSYPRLSTGERSRVQLARVLAQIWEPVAYGARYLLLDEPTASQDLAHQHACLQLARRLAATGIGVLAILHDPNLALAYADEISLLCCGELLAQGTPARVLMPELLGKVYGVEVDLLHAPSSARPYLAVRSRV